MSKKIIGNFYALSPFSSKRIVKLQKEENKKLNAFIDFLAKKAFKDIKKNESTGPTSPRHSL